eukprot:SAG25_NODE_261_length_10763_cov_3.334300_7_plen_195_part_00
MHSHNASFRLRRMSHAARRTLLTMLYKNKGDVWDLVRYRPVSCKSTIYQNLAGILFSRWAEYAPAIVPVDQCGFVHRRYILDVLHRLFDTLDKVDLEAMLEACGAPVLAVLIHSRDLDKCFDRISHAGLWRVLCHACGYQATYEECDIDLWQATHAAPFGSHFPRAVQWFIIAMADHECSRAPASAANIGPHSL